MRVNEISAMLGTTAESKMDPFIMSDQTVHGTLVTNGAVRPDTSRLSSKLSWT